MTGAPQLILREGRDDGSGGAEQLPIFGEVFKDPKQKSVLKDLPIHRYFKVPREKLTPDDDFFKTLGIDSLQALDLLTRLEHHFHVELPDYELQGVTDFRTLAARIQSRL